MSKILLTVFAVIFVFSVTGQNFGLDTRELLDVVKKWNYANNSRSDETFREIYADRLVFYTQSLSEEKCIALKKSLFLKNPDFKQKIVSDPIFTPLTSGVIKAEFTKEVFQKGVWKRYPSYLLITYENGGYFITGESDKQTDKRLNYKPSLGQPMDIPQSKGLTPKKSTESASNDTMSEYVPDTTIIASSDSLENDSLDVASVEGDSTVESEDSALLTSVQNEVLSDEPVAVPKKYVYFLIGFLVLAALVVLFSAKPKRRQKKDEARVLDRESVVIRNDRGFESFLTALFDPLYFTVRTHARQPVYAGNVSRNEFLPNLDVEFRNKDAHVRMAIECIYIGQIASRQLLSYSPQQINRYHEFEEETGAEVYIIVGIEGEASDPKEIYLIPASELREGYLGYAELKPYRKHGMFFYNAVRRRLL